MGMVAQGVKMQNDGNTEFFRMQNNSPNTFNGAGGGVEEGDNFHPQEDRVLSEAEAVVGRLAPEEVTQMAVLLITFIAGEVPMEKWQALDPRLTVPYAKRMLKARDDTVAQALENLRAAVAKTDGKNRKLAQEVLIALDGQRAAEQMEQ